MNTVTFTDGVVRQLAKKVAEQIRANGLTDRNCYPIPRGGIPAAYMVQQYVPLTICLSPETADYFLDDLIDSGKTLSRFAELEPDTPFYALYDKRENENSKEWIVFPWEDSLLGSAEDIVLRQLQVIGEDINREGLVETPKRVVRAWESWFDGYKMDPADFIKTFDDGREGYDDMIIVRDIPFYSHCEHHLAPFFGTATIAYLPNKKIVGLSKLSRIVDMYAHRLQVQERLTTQVAQLVDSVLEPKGVGCIIKARHLCMESRGIAKQGHVTITSSTSGALREKSDARAEFMSLAQ